MHPHAKRLPSLRPLLPLLLTATLIGAMAHPAEAQVESQKLPGEALSLSLLVPGAGQAYNGQWTKGGLMLGGQLAALGVLLKYNSCDLFDYNRECDRFNIALVGMVGLTLWSLIDAPINAIAINRRIDAGQVALEIGPQLVAPNGDSRVGVSLVRVTF